MRPGVSRRVLRNFLAPWDGTGRPLCGVSRSPRAERRQRVDQPGERQAEDRLGTEQEGDEGAVVGLADAAREPEAVVVHARDERAWPVWQRLLPQQTRSAAESGRWREEGGGEGRAAHRSSG